MVRLREDYINSLAQPFIAHFYAGMPWPVSEIDVETGCIIVDIMGKFQCTHIDQVDFFMGANGNKHDSYSFYADYESRREYYAKD